MLLSTRRSERGQWRRLPSRNSRPAASVAEIRGTRVRWFQSASRSLQAVDEELHDVWFEKVPELDVVSVAGAQFILTCLYLTSHDVANSY